jgi:hypothetical protein
MSQEHESRPITGIHINLQDISLTLESDGHPVATLTFSPHGTLSFHPSSHTAEIQSGDDTLEEPGGSNGDAAASGANAEPADAVEDAAAGKSKEKAQTVVVTGRLKSQPQAGRPDRRGKPTAWARFATHEDGNPDAHLYLATFHRHTTRIALSLPQGAPITAEGYAHPADDPSGKRTDTFSIINLLAYPGKGDST